MVPRLAMLIALVFVLPHRLDAAESTAPQIINTQDDVRYKFVRLRDGTLLGLFDGRMAHPDGPPSDTVKAKRSTDNGVTWSKAEPLFPIPTKTGTWGITEALVDHDDELHAFLMIAGSGVQATGGEGERPLVGELSGARIDIGYIRSTNGRTQWTKPRVLWIGYTGALNSVIQMRSGRIALPFSYLTARNWGNRGEGLAAFTFVGQYNCTVIYSDDGGATWQLGTDLSVPVPDIVSAYGAVEPVVVQLEDGRVWNLIRTQMGRFWESYSNDGATWSEPQPTSIISSDSPAGLVRLSDGRIVLFWNNCLRYPYAYGGRQVLHAAISEDSGRSWRGFREVGRDPFRNEAPPSGHDYGTAYPFPTLANNDKVIFVSGQGEGRILRKLLDPAWLYETRQTADFAQRAEEWSTFGTRGVEIVPHPTEPDRKILQIRKTDERWPAAAVWNFPAGATGRLRLRILTRAGFQGALVALTDHFSTPFDLEDHFNSVHNLWIGADGRLPNDDSLKTDEWNNLELAWDSKRQSCEVLLDGKSAGSLPLVRSSPNVCYLRLRSTAERTDEAGFRIESVEADVGPDTKAGTRELRSSN